MPRYKKPGTGRDFLPGQSGNPKGRPPEPPELKAMKRMTKGELSLLINKYMQMDLVELGAIAHNPTTKAIDAMISSIIIQCIKQGDYTRLNFFLDRELGKVSEKIEVAAYKDMSDIELLEEAKKETALLEKKIKGE
jgi:hypothetical protein